MIARSLLKYCHKQNVHLKQASNWSWVRPNGKDTGVKIYNSITRSVEPLLLSRNALYWYMCGPTVYSDAHIGHGFCYVKFDIIRRILESFFNINVVQVMGITDIDDKIINKANLHKMGFLEISRKYEKEFMKDMRDLNVQSPTATVRVTDSITHIINFISRLVEQNQAYRTADGSVYFDQLSYGYGGKLQPISIESEETLERNPLKKNAADFALWKATKPNEPWWESPWGNGRPGWHIECSAIASNIFGSNIDIHSGGVDLIFPHHENELAQSEAYHSCHQWVNYWLHAGHLIYKQEKMSKSLQNTISIQEFLKTFTADEFRIFCLLSYYRNNADFIPNAMDEACKILSKLKSFSTSVKAYIDGQLAGGVVNESEVLERLENCKTAFKESLANDFNTHEALINILNLVSYTNILIQNTNKATVSRSPAAIAAVDNYVRNILESFGIRNYGAKNTCGSAELDNVMSSALQLRKQVRQTSLKRDANIGQLEKAEILDSCDQFRRSLLDSGIKIQDRGAESSWSFTK
ncbi:hypothetical protein CHUAL_011502 [Chamberlinius hualienensis]